jgi:hypothetical protein
MYIHRIVLVVRGTLHFDSVSQSSTIEETKKFMKEFIKTVSLGEQN